MSAARRLVALSFLAPAAVAATVRCLSRGGLCRQVAAQRTPGRKPAASAPAAASRGARASAAPTGVRAPPKPKSTRAAGRAVAGSGWPGRCCPRGALWPCLAACYAGPCPLPTPRALASNPLRLQASGLGCWRRGHHPTTRAAWLLGRCLHGARSAAVTALPGLHGARAGGLEESQGMGQTSGEAALPSGFHTPKAPVRPSAGVVPVHPIGPGTFLVFFFNPNRECSRYGTRG